MTEEKVDCGYMIGSSMCAVCMMSGNKCPVKEIRNPMDTLTYQINKITK